MLTKRSPTNIPIATTMVITPTFTLACHHQCVTHIRTVTNQFIICTRIGQTFTIAICTSPGKVWRLTGATVFRGLEGFGAHSRVHSAKIPRLSSDLSMVEQIVAVIRENAHTGLRGDGKIYVSDVQSALRIQDNETGEDAV